MGILPNPKERKQEKRIVKRKRNRTMSKAEEFIKAKTRIGSNTTKGWRRNGVSIPSYSLPWLTPDNAKCAVEIAREEAIEQTVEWLTKHVKKYFNKDRYLGTDELVEDYKLIMSMNHE